MVRSLHILAFAIFFCSCAYTRYFLASPPVTPFPRIQSVSLLASTDTDKWKYDRFDDILKRPFIESMTREELKCEKARLKENLKFYKSALAEGEQVKF